MKKLASTAVALALAGCGPAGNAATPLLEAPAYAPDQAKARVRADPLRPLIVEWPNAERGALEAQVKRGGLVAVRYVDGEMELRASCRVAVPYRYQGIEAKLEHVVMRTTDDTAANIPIHAASFNARLATAGALVVDMRIIGRYEAPPRRLWFDVMDGDCTGVSHVVTAFTVGAFEFFTDANATVGGGASIAGMGASTASSAARETLNRDGDGVACGRAKGADPRPPEGCRSVLRLELVKVDVEIPPELRGLPECAGEGDSAACERRCEAGSPRACGILARMHMLGEGAPKDLVRSLELNERACKGDEVVSCGNLGAAYVLGRGVEPNPGRGREILTNACSRGERQACHYVGALHLEGNHGVDRSRIEARRYFTEACRLGLDVGCTSVRLTDRAPPARP